ncbi:unnamed protein product [Phytophthora lilii]|uniref:Unnamed protein product n=1 Tax=Phytophthora lilii TaxID=2077276 RepID=A0A9W6WVH8_9STRA|nr:unnamed protein product [Phytophthora lilii]
MSCNEVTGNDAQVWSTKKVIRTEIYGSRIMKSPPDTACRSHCTAFVHPVAELSPVASLLGEPTCGTLERRYALHPGRVAADRAPSMFDTFGGSDQSLPSATTGSLTSRDSSSASSMWSSSRGGHLPYAGIVLSARDQGGAASAGPVGMYVTHTVLPSAPAEVDQDDVVMSESASTYARKRRSKAASGARTRRSEATLSSSSEEPSASDDEGRRHRRSRSRRGSKRSSQSRKRSSSRRSRRLSRSVRSEVSAASATSGATQVALNTMNQVQDAVSQMERKQGSTLKKIGLDLKAELARMVHDQLGDVRPKQEPTRSHLGPALETPPAEALEAARVEAARLERERVEAELGQHHAQEQAHLAQETQRNAAMRESVQRELNELRADRDRERETAKNLQTFLTRQLRDLRTTATNTQRAVATSGRDTATQAQTDVGRATLHPFAGNPTTSHAPKCEHGKGIGRPARRSTRDAQASVAKTETAPAEEVSPHAPSITLKRDVSERANKANTESNRSVPKKKFSKKASRRRDDPPDSDPSSDSSSDDSSSEDSDSSSFKDVTPNVTTTTTSQGGTTVFTFNLYVNASSLEDINEKASLVVRVRWLERFQSLAVHGCWTDKVNGCWTDKVKLYQFKLKLSSSVRNWRSSLQTSVRRNWKKFIKAFLENYCKARTSDSERCYTVVQKKSETPREFYYRLNKVADKAGNRFSHGEHAALKDLAYVLKQHEEIWQDDDYDTPPSRKPDPRANNQPQGRFRQRRSDRAYVTQSDDDSEGEDTRQVRFQDEVEEVTAKEATSVSTTALSEAGSVEAQESSLKQNISDEVYKVMDNIMNNSRWKPSTRDTRPKFPFGLW